MTRPIAFTANVLRQWWVPALVLVVLLAVAGVAAGQRSDVSTGVLFRVDPTATDSTRVTQSTQTAVRIIDSTDVYDAAATALGSSAQAVRETTTVAVVPSSELVSLSVRCRAAEVCTGQLDALVAATQERVQGTAQNQFSAIADGGAAALLQGALPDLDAERARRAELGTQTAERQNGALQTGTEITLVGSPTPATRTGLTPAVGGSAGAATGLLLVGIGVLALGGRRGRIRSTRDWVLRRGTDQVYEREEIGRIAQQLVSDRLPLVLVLPTGRHSLADTATVARSLQTELENEGAAAALVRITRNGTTLMDAEGASIARVPSPLAVAGRGELLTRCQAHVAVAYCDTQVPVAARAAGRVPATVFTATGPDASYRDVGDALDSVAPSPSYAVLV